MSKNYIINNLINSLQKLPTIGQKTAKRIALNILQNKEYIIKPLINSLTEAYEKVNKCKICGNFTTNDLCDICGSEIRDKTVICIVESIADFMGH